jgi:hypothetical protein
VLLVLPVLPVLVQGTPQPGDGDGKVEKKG